MLVLVIHNSNCCWLDTNCLPIHWLEIFQLQCIFPSVFVARLCAESLKPRALVHRIACARAHKTVHIYRKAHVGVRAQAPARIFWAYIYHPFSEHFSLTNVTSTENLMTSNQDLITRKCHRCSSLLPLPRNTYSYYLLTISNMYLYLSMFYLFQMSICNQDWWNQSRSLSHLFFVRPTDHSFCINIPDLYSILFGAFILEAVFVSFSKPKRILV
jgi:hypothetical protein